MAHGFWKFNYIIFCDRKNKKILHVYYCGGTQGKPFWRRKRKTRKETRVTRAVLSTGDDDEVFKSWRAGAFLATRCVGRETEERIVEIPACRLTCTVCFSNAQCSKFSKFTNSFLPEIDRENDCRTIELQALSFPSTSPVQIKRQI